MNTLYEQSVTLTPEDRFIKLQTLLTQMREAPVSSAKGSFHTQDLKNRFTDICEEIGVLKRLTEEKSLQAHELIKTREYSIRDNLLELLITNPAAPALAYQHLFNLISHRYEMDAEKIAHYLYHKRGYHSISIISSLMLHANRKRDFHAALTYFNDTYTQFDPTEEREILSYHLIDTYISLNKRAQAQALCLARLATFYDITYTPFALLHRNERIDATNNAILKNPFVYRFCAKLAQVISVNNIDESIFILESLYEAAPDEINAIMRLGVLYEKKHEFAKTSKLYTDYLSQHPDNLVLCTHYIQFLMNIKCYELIQPICAAFIQNYSKNHTDLRKINILHGWFHENYQEGKKIFEQLLITFPYQAMIAYLSIRYALKIRDVAWQNTLIEKTMQIFQDPQFRNIISSLSQCRMIYSAINEDYYAHSELLHNQPQGLVLSKACPLPASVEQYFYLFCTCGTKPCQSHCLDNIYLTGETAARILQFNKAISENSVFNLDLQKHDLDFVIFVPEINNQPFLQHFSRSPFITNVFTRKGAHGEPDIDVRFYVTGEGTETELHDITQMTEGRDLLHTMLLLNAKGVAFDYTKGESFAAAEGAYLKIHGQALEKLQQDPVRILRVIKKLIHNEYQLHPSLEKALRKISPPNWLENERLRKKFCDLLIQPWHQTFIHLMRYYQLLELEPSIAIDAADRDVFEFCVIKVVSYLREHNKETELSMYMRQLRNATETTTKHLEAIRLHTEIETLQQTLQTTIISSRESQNTSSKKSNQSKKLKKQIKELNTQSLTYELKLQRIQAQYDKLIEKRKLLTLEEELSCSRRSHDNDVTFQRLLSGSNYFFSPENIAKEHCNTASLLARWQPQSWDIEALRKILSYTAQIHFSAFILLHMGCFYTYQVNDPHLAWMYLSMTKKYLIAMTKDEVVLEFINEILEPFIQKTLLNTDLETCNEAQLKQRIFEQLRTQSKIRASQKPMDPQKIVALIEYYLSLPYLSKAERHLMIKRALEHGIYEKAQLFYGSYFLINELLMQHNELHADLKETISVFLTEQIGLAEKDDHDERIRSLSRLKLIYALHFFKFLEYGVSEDILSCHFDDHFLATMSASTLYSLCFKESIYQLTADLQSIYHLQLAEDYLIAHEDERYHLPCAKSHYQHMIAISSNKEELSEIFASSFFEKKSSSRKRQEHSKDTIPLALINQPILGCFRMWSETRLNHLNTPIFTQDEAISSMIPLFRNMIIQWEATGSLKTSATNSFKNAGGGSNK